MRDDASGGPGEATTIYRARRIITMSGDGAPGGDAGDGDRAEALAIRAGRVAAVGAARDLVERFPRAERVELGDAIVVPGFHDAHAHLAMTAEDLLHLDLSADAAPSIAEIAAAVCAEAQRTTPGGWIRGSRYDDGKIAERRGLTRWDLDAAAPDHPVLVIHVAGHWGVVNSRALELAGIDEASEPPAGGAFGRDAAGRLDGRLIEQALFDFAYPQASKTGTTVAPASSFDDRLRGLARAVERFHAAGLTSLTDALVGPQDVHLFRAGERTGALSLRVTMLVSAEHYERVLALGVADVESERLRFGGVKTFVDGAIGGRTCLLEQPFEGTTDDFGMQTVPTAELREIVRMVHDRGHRICVHANGDRAIRLLLEQLEAVAPAVPPPRIEHCTVVTEEILARMQRLGAIAVPFGSYVHYHGSKLLDWYGTKRMERMFAHRWFLDAGVPVAGSSDYPCGPFEPLLAMQSCVTRRGWDGPVMGANQRITPREALALYTTAAAHAAGEAHVKGRLAPGYLGDFTVLGADPLTVDPERLREVPVRATYVGGRCVWRAVESG